VEDERHQISDTFPEARIGFDHRDFSFFDRRRHRRRHLYLIRSRFERVAGQLQHVTGVDEKIEVLVGRTPQTKLRARRRHTRSVKLVFAVTT
jgi:hypothetical protein